MVFLQLGLVRGNAEISYPRVAVHFEKLAGSIQVLPFSFSYKWRPLEYSTLPSPAIIKSRATKVTIPKFPREA